MSDTAAVPPPPEGDFDRLLLRLDEDRDRAAEKYEELRRLLIKFFQWNRSLRAHELADETLERVAAKAVDEIVNMRAYVRKVGRFVFLEDIKKHRGESSIEEVCAQGDPVGSNPEKEILEGIDEQVRLDCLRHCLTTLPPKDRALAIDYYSAEGEKLKVHRRKLAIARTITMDALRVQANRVREKLERCVTECLRDRRNKFKEADGAI
jgi:hypothetical protein